MNEQIKKLTEKKKTLTDKDKKKAIDNKITILKLKKETKKSTNNIALGTSKTNYIDPRIIFSFIKKYDIPTEKIMPKALIKRFEWASKVGNDFIF
jgi:DNA topoisomerase-1